MLNQEVGNSSSYSLPVGRYAAAGARGIGRFAAAGARGFGRVLWALKPGPVLLILAAEVFVQACLGVRMYFSFQGGDPTGRLAQMHEISDTLVSPFHSWDGTVVVNKNVFELSTIVAMDVYLFAAIGAIVLLVMMRTFVAFAGYVVGRFRARRERRVLAAQQADSQEPAVAPSGAPVAMSTNHEIVTDQVA